MFSIDQNCHSLWDALPKLQCLARRGVAVRHFIEDIDVAFTAIGSATGQTELRLAQERYHRSGGADWGAALFYSEFLGRLPTEIRRWEPFTGLATKVLAGRLGRSVDELYDDLSPSDNWQLIGPSYVGDRGHHRVVGDLSVAEVGRFVREILAKASADMTNAFPHAGAQKRLAEWFNQAEARVDRLLSECRDGGLVKLYRSWLGEYLGQSVQLDLTSDMFALGAGEAGTALLELFLRDYDTAAGLYNEAVAEAGVELRPLKTVDGELPFFATFRYQGHKVRSICHLRNGELHAADMTFALADGRLPIEQLRRAGIECIAGKAILLVVQARLGPAGQPLVVPHNGSAYMPAAQLLAAKLAERDILPGKLKPIYRLRFRLLDRMRKVSTTIRLPAYLARAFGKGEIPAATLGSNYEQIARDAAGRLGRLSDPAGRSRWQAENFEETSRQIDELDRRRRKLAQADAKSQEIRQASHKIKALRTEILAGTLRRIADDWHLSRIGYWDSRGALLPWSIALGGEDFYDDLLARAELYEEPNP